MLSIIHFIAENYNYKIDYIYDEMPLISSFLLLRQKLASEGKIGIFLSDKEMLDNNSWEDLLAENKKNRM
jgi:hypothetical protein